MSSKSLGPANWVTCEPGEVVWEFNEGRPRIRHYPNGGDIQLHRLAAVAWYGWDAVIDNEVHHRVPVSWLNIESNLLPIRSEEHQQLTTAQHKNGVPEKVVESVENGMEGGEE